MDFHLLMEPGLIKTSGVNPQILHLRVRSALFLTPGHDTVSPRVHPFVVWCCWNVIRAWCDPGQVLTEKNITSPWAWQQCRVLQLLNSGVPVYLDYPGGVFFSMSTSSSIPLDVEAIWASHATTADGTDGQRNSEESGDPTYQVWQFICFGENSYIMQRVYRKYL